MSIKTLRKRIALVAVSALGVGLMSVVAAPVANSAVTSANKFSVAIGNSSSGSNVVTAGGGDTTLDKSIGFVAVTSANGTDQEAVAATAVTVKAGTVGTANVLAGSKLVLGVTGGAITDRVAISCENGTLSNRSSATIASTVVQIAGNSLTVTSNGHGLLVGDRVTVDSTTAGFDVSTAVAITAVTDNTFTVPLTGANAGPTTEAGVITLQESSPFNGTNTAVYRSNGANPSLAAVATVNPGATSMTCSAWKGASVTAATPTNGTLIGRWVFTVVSASVSGVVSAADSTAYIGASQAKGTACTAAPNDTAPTFDNLARIDNGRVACIDVDLYDAYGVAIGSTGTLTASATNGSLVQIGGAAADAYTASLSFDSDTYATGSTWISVLQPVSNTAGSTTVTITYQGVVIGTKTINWNGIAASIELDTANSASIFFAGGSSAGTVPAGSKLGIVYRIKDAAGNIVTFASQPTVADATGSMIAANLETAAGAATEQVVQSISAGKGTTTMYLANSNLTGDGTYKLKITNSAGTVIKSPEYKAKVVGGVATFTASWDKASYNPGEIATLTIKGLDAAGRPAADGTLLGTGTVITVNTDGFGHLTSTCETTPATSSAFLGGQKTCKFAVKNTPGSYSYSVKVATSTSQAETAGTLNVVASTSTVTNAEVLAAIVKLIASINKQIKALQKSLRR